MSGAGNNLSVSPLIEFGVFYFGLTVLPLLRAALASPTYTIAGRPALGGCESASTASAGRGRRQPARRDTSRGPSFVNISSCCTRYLTVLLALYPATRSSDKPLYLLPAVAAMPRSPSRNATGLKAKLHCAF